MRTLSRLFSSCVAVLLSGTALAQPLNSAFEYQGELTDGGVPAAGTYDVQFALFDAAAGGTQVGATLCVNDMAVTDGRFSASLNFGGVFTGQLRYLEVRVRTDTGVACATGGAYTTLSPRQTIGATPNASFALNAAIAGNSSLLGGQGSSFYQNATNLTTGTLGAGMLPATAARTDTSQTFTGLKTFSTAPLFSAVGAPFTVGGTGLVANLNADLLDGLTSTAFATASHSHAATDIASGTLADARLSANVAMRNAANTFSGAATFSAASTFNGLVGIGTASPGDLLHVSGGDAGVTLPNGGARVIIEDNGLAYLNFLTPAASENGILFGLEGNAASGGLVYNAAGTPLGLQFRTNGNATRMVIDDAGNVGIGTAAPTGRLTVSGAVGDATVVLPTQSVSVAENFEESFTDGSLSVLGTPLSLSTSWSTLQTMVVSCESANGAVYLSGTVELVNLAGIGSNTIELAITKGTTPTVDEVRRHTIIGDSGADSYALVTVVDVDTGSVAGSNTYRLMARELSSSDSQVHSHGFRGTYSR